MSLDASWAHLFNPGVERVRLEVSELGVMAMGEVEERVGPSLLRLHYTILCDPDWNVKEIMVDRHSPQTGSVDLIGDGMGKWYNAACQEIPSLEGCTEVDLSASAFTNTIPIRKLDLAVDQKAELKVVYLDARSMQPKSSTQRYTCVKRLPNESVYYYEGLDTGFRVQLRVDSDGLVMDYPGVFRRNDLIH